MVKAGNGLAVLGLWKLEESTLSCRLLVYRLHQVLPERLDRTLREMSAMMQTQEGCTAALWDGPEIPESISHPQ
jgi:hypothetical protein